MNNNQKNNIWDQYKDYVAQEGTNYSHPLKRRRYLGAEPPKKQNLGVRHVKWKLMSFLVICGQPAPHTSPNTRHRQSPQRSAHCV